MYANAHKKKGGGTIRPSDFYNKMVLKEEKQTPEEMKAAMMQLVNETSPKKGAEKKPKGKTTRKTKNG